MSDNGHILIVDDEREICQLVRDYLTEEGYRVSVSYDGSEMRQVIGESPVDLVLLDVVLPREDGLSLARALRTEKPDIGIIMLTGRGETIDRIVGLELGADDYIAKPFSPRELTARVKAVLRRAAGPLTAQQEPAVLRAGDLVVDVVVHEAHLAGEPVALTSKEFDLLAHLMRNPRKAFRREELLEEVWGFSYGDTSTVTVHVRRLREKIEADPSNPRYVCTVWGVGYRFEP
jgi:DNA-binding response OmpR family regulator